MPGAKGRKPIRPSKLAKAVVSKLSKALEAKLIRQQQRHKQQVKANKAQKAVSRFRTRKADRDSFIFVETSGKRDSGKGRKGYLVYIGKRGKKYIIPDLKDGLKAKRKGELIPRAAAGSPKAQGKLSGQRLQTRSGQPVIKGSGKITVSGSKYDFSDKIVGKFARGVTKVLNAQAGFRDFTIRAMVLVELPGGQTKVYQIDVVLQKPQHVKIPVEHIFNFIKQQFFAVLAQQLAYDGYVTSGSANHVRGLKENRGKSKGKWTKGGIPWHGRHDVDIVKIKVIDWQAIQNR